MSSKGIDAVTAESDQRGEFVPKLRFPEFVGKPLHDVCLGDVTEEATARNRNNLARASVMGVRKDDGIVPMQERLVAGNISRYKNVRKNWFAYNPMRLNIGSIARWQGDHEVLVSPDYVVFRCLAQANPTPLIPDYLDHFRSSEQWEAFTNESGDGGVRIRIYYRDLARMRLLLPDTIEQQKIADCLSSIDALISAEAAKLGALYDQKRGLMQQLFPTPGETVPRFRFPEFRGAKAWELATIKDIGSFYYGKSAPKWSLEEDAPTPCVRYGELYSKFDIIIEETFSRTTIDPKNLRFSKGGEILVPRVGEKPDDFGKYCCFLPLNGIAIGEMISVFETNQNPLFYTYYFRHLYKEFAKVVEGQNVKNLYYTNLEPLAICRPTIHEQGRIASALSSLDALITGSSMRLEALKAHRKGLKQQLLPVVEETGS